MSFEKVFYSSFVKGVGRTVGVLTIFGSLGLLYISFTNLYNYNQDRLNNKENKQTITKEEKNVVEVVPCQTDGFDIGKVPCQTDGFDIGKVPCQLKSEMVEVDIEDHLDIEEEEKLIETIETIKIKNYENNELFKKLFDKIK